LLTTDPLITGSVAVIITDSDEECESMAEERQIAPSQFHGTAAEDAELWLDISKIIVFIKVMTVTVKFSFLKSYYREVLPSG